MLRPLQVTGGMLRELKPAVVAELAPLGSVPLRCCPGEHEALYSLPRYAAAALAQTAAAEFRSPLQEQQQQQGEATAGISGAAAGSRAGLATASRPPAVPASAVGTITPSAPAASPRFAAPPAPQDKPSWPSGAHAAKLAPLLPDAKCDDSLPYNQGRSEPGPPADLLLRFEDPQLESAFVRYNGEAQRPGAPPPRILSSLLLPVHRRQQLLLCLLLLAASLSLPALPLCCRCS